MIFVPVLNCIMAGIRLPTLGTGSNESLKVQQWPDEHNIPTYIYFFVFFFGVRIAEREQEEIKHYSQIVQ